jgi:regulator of ribonuclease activity A
MRIATADLWDDHMEHLSLLNLDLLNFGGKTSFGGKIVTLKLFEDNSYVRKTLQEDGTGKVLFVDGGGSKRCALLGDNIANLAIDNGWEGIIIYGCIRDSKVIKDRDIGIKAIGTCPVKSAKRHSGLRGETLLIGGTKIKDGDYVYSDDDGVLISSNKLV